MRREVDEVFDFLARVHPFLVGHAGDFPGFAQFAKNLLVVMQCTAQHHLRLDAGHVAHVHQRLARENRPSVAVAAALHIHQRQAALARRLFGFLRVARKQEAHVGPHIGSAVQAHARFLKAQRAAGIGAGDDHEIRVGLVALAHRVLDLVDKLLDRDAMHNVLVIVGALGVKLVLDVNAGNPVADEFAYRAHGVERLAEAGAGIG